MRNFLVIGAAVLAAGLLAGCGHNAIQYGDGVGFDVGINPENCTLSLNLRYGKIFSAVTRDNVEIELTGKANADGSAGIEKTAQSSVGTDGNLKVKIGRQINGAAVDLVEAGANADKVLQELNSGNAETKEATESKETETKTETKAVTEPKTETAAEKTAAEVKTETKTETKTTEIK